MSWQAYVDDHLMCEIDGQYLTSAAIFGHDGNPWSQSPNFPQVSEFYYSVSFFYRFLQHLQSVVILMLSSLDQTEVSIDCAVILV